MNNRQYTSPPDDALIIETLAATQRRLLDLTRRNRVLNHRSEGRRTLRVVEEAPDEVYRLLVSRGQTLQFLAHEEAPTAVRKLITVSADADEETPQSNSRTNGHGRCDSNIALAPIATSSKTAVHHTDLNLQTSLQGPALQTRLLHLAREANSAYAEQGTNILYLTLGIVEWQENSQGPISRAPLIFVPVELQRLDVQSRHCLSLFDDDILVNASLVELCVRTMSFDFPHCEIDDTFNIASYFTTVAEAIANYVGWQLLPEVHLGLFSFAKLLMYRDLDPETWPAKRNIVKHALLRTLSGIDSANTVAERTYSGELPKASDLDHILVPEETFQVVDADSSQQVAILGAKQGHSMVIEGPPGTGKSQTITNIIAEFLAAEKTVLFVSEKAAALSVVQRRLEAVGLGDCVLELHSHRASKRVVMEELNRTLTIAEQCIAVPKSDVRELEQTKAQSNQYVHELHTPLGALAIAPFTAIVRATELRSAPEVSCPVVNPLDWTLEEFDNARFQLATLDRWLGRVSEQEAHPWHGVGLTVFGTQVRQQLQRSLQQINTALREIQEAAKVVAAQLGITIPTTAVELSKAIANAMILLELPELDPSIPVDDRWDYHLQELDIWLTLGIGREQHKAEWVQRAQPSAEWIDWQKILERRRQHESSLIGSVVPAQLKNWAFRHLDAKWEADAAQIQRHLLPNIELSVTDQLKLLEVLTASRELRVAILNEVPRFADQFGKHWQSIDSDWHTLGTIAEAARAVRLLVRNRVVGATAAQRIVANQDRTELQSVLGAARQAVGQAATAWEAWYATIASTEQQWLKEIWQLVPFSSLIERIATLPNAMDQIDDWIHLQAAIQTCTNGPLAPFAAWAMSAEGIAARGQIEEGFTRQFYRLWIDDAVRMLPALQHFRGVDHESMLKRFRQSDLKWIEANQVRVARMVQMRQPNIAHGDSYRSKRGILKAEMRKKRRHMPLRQLIAQTGEVIQSLKPCFMMSPVSIAQFLAPGAIEFDLVIFDEASQVEPADAYGAIARGRQLVLVGDENQLPPTDFFNKIEIEVDGLPQDTTNLLITDLESILSLGIVRLSHQCALRWHYRSRHASLIEFSNQRFYDGQLRIFPGPYTNTKEYGLTFRYIEDSVYMRGTSQDNITEAQTIAQEVVQHAHQHPHLSLGVGAFSVAQQRAIEDEIERLRRESENPVLESFFNKHSEEPFFVKNLETIQGDERDVIFLSVGYGRDQYGKLNLNFGPLNHKGGWRRLNVLVTRARQRCVLFSSIRASDMNISGTQARGIIALKEYLSLAEQGHLTQAALTSGQHDSPFEAAVCQALRDRGWEVHPQVGSAGFFIDLAVVDPQAPGRYLLGIECDGATYHSSATARDRDRLRQQVLENLGWTIHRVWSTDWFNRPDMTLQQILEHLEKVSKNCTSARITQRLPLLPPAPDTSEKLEPSNTEQQRAAPSPETRRLPMLSVEQNRTEPRSDKQACTYAIQLYTAAPLRQHKSSASLMDTSVDELCKLIVDVVRNEAPIHIEEVQRIIASYFNTRVTKRLQEVVEEAITSAKRVGAIRQRKQFLWITTITVVPIRIRNGDCPVIRSDLIAPEEFQAAVKAVLADKAKLKHSDLVVNTSRLLGYRRCGPNLEQAINCAFTALSDQGQLTRDNQDFLVLT